MNRIYRLVWNRTLGIVQVATEFAKAPRGGAQGSRNVGGSPPRSRLARACTAALLIGLGATALPAWAGTYTVTSSTDSGNTATSGSLSWAIAQANANPDSTIDFGSVGTITETGTLPTLTAITTFTAAGDVTIDGAMTSSSNWAWTGTGTLTLAGDGTTFYGSAYVFGGTLDVGYGSANVQITGASNHGNGQFGVGIIHGYSATTNTSGLNVAAGGVVQGGNGLDGYSSGFNGGTGVGVYSGTATIDNAGTIAGGSGGAGYGGYSGPGYGGQGFRGGVGGAGVAGYNLSLTNSGSITGGDGAIGGAGGYAYSNNGDAHGGGGGRGGNGGAGVISRGGNLTLTNSGTISGGAGGAGGISGFANGYDASYEGAGGAGSYGGAGIYMRAGEGSIYSSATLTNSGTISGGMGGAGADGYNVSYFSSLGVGNVYGSQGGDGGNGGYGVYGGYGVNFTLANSGTISGGAGGSGGTGGSFAHTDADGIYSGSGGQGGNGGVGVSGDAFSLTNSGMISGGAGGDGGASGGIYYGYGVTANNVGNSGYGNGYGYGYGYGRGGAGGDGVTGSSFTLTNSGTISGGAGGNGGAGGSISHSYSAGANQAGDGGYGGDGGDGVAGDVFTLTNSGVISGGAGGAGADGGNTTGSETIGQFSANYGGAGGGGGYGGSGVAGLRITLTNSGTISAGAGGAGGNGGSISDSKTYGYGNAAGRGGSGVDAGAGVGGFSVTLTNSGAISGGNGGNGGAGGNVVNSTGGYFGNFAGDGGNGGAGGPGVSGYYVNLTNTGTITGGNGGNGGAGGTAAGGNDGSQGAGGYGGAGVMAFGDNATIINGGTIAGGQAGTGNGLAGGRRLAAVGNTQADAIDFSGANNTLELWGGYNFVGNVVNFSGGTNTLILGGSVDDSFNLSQIVTAMPTTYSGTPVYYGFGQFSKTGASTWTLIGANPDTEAWTVSAGKLEVGDAAHPGTVLNGSVTVNGGAVGGHGTITGDVNVTAGLVQPGGSVGVLTVGGNFTQDASSTLMLEITADPTPGTGSSQLMVGGSASVAGTLSLQIDSFSGSTYDLVHADGGISGTFSTVTIPSLLEPYLNTKVTYQANDVLLNLSPTDKAYTQGYPNYAATVGLGAERTFDAVLGRLGPAANGRQGVWGQFLAGVGGLGQGSRYQYNVTAAGYGREITDRFVLGVAVSGGTAATTLSPMQVRAKPLGGFVYGIWRNRGWRVSGSLGTGWTTQRTLRYLTGTPWSEQAFSHGHYAGAALRMEYTAKLGGWQLSPYGGLDTLNARYGASREVGMGLLALDYSKVSQHLTHYQAGLKLATTWGGWHPWVKAGTEGWRGERATQVTENFYGFRRVFTSSQLPINALNGGAGVTYHSGGWDTSVSWNGSWGTNFHGNDAMLQVRYRW